MSMKRFFVVMLFAVMMLFTTSVKAQSMFNAVRASAVTKADEKEQVEESKRWARPFDTHEKILIGAFVAGNIVDYGQTQWGLNNGYREGNTIMFGSGERARMVGVKILGIGLITGTAYLSDNHLLRKVMLYTANAIQWGVVGHNIAVEGGLHFKF